MPINCYRIIAMDLLNTENKRDGVRVFLFKCGICSPDLDMSGGAPCHQRRQWHLQRALPALKQAPTSGWVYPSLDSTASIC